MNLEDKWFLYSLIGILVFVTLLLVVLFITSSSCIEDPLGYGIDKMSELGAGDLVCNCFFEDPRADTFTIDRHNITFSPLYPQLTP